MPNHEAIYRHDPKRYHDMIAKQPNLRKVIQDILNVEGKDVVDLGAGTTEPDPPSFLQPYYHALEHQYGFASSLIRTDYQFANVEEAVQYLSFFFGDKLAEHVLAQQLATVMEWAGIWWRKGRMSLYE